MKLFHHGYQGKHARGQVPRQRDDEGDKERASDPMSDASDARAQGTDLPAQRPPTADESADSSQPH
jgi:hypothetical protein